MTAADAAQLIARCDLIDPAVQSLVDNYETLTRETVASTCHRIRRACQDHPELTRAGTQAFHIHMKTRVIDRQEFLKHARTIQQHVLIARTKAELATL